MVIINGQTRESISLHDRGLQYGDGCFETLAVRNGKVQLWEYHWQRLNTSCARLGLPSLDKADVCSQITKVTEGNSRCVVKIIVTRGAGERGYRIPEPARPTLIVYASPFPAIDESNYSEGVAVRVCATPASINPALAGIKHLNRLENVLARSEWNDTQWYEGLMLTAAGDVVEATSSNVFWVKNNILYTPALEQAGVAGIMRRVVIETARRLGISLEETKARIDALHSADEIFLTNSIIRLMPVRKLEQYDFGVINGANRITRMLANDINRQIDNEG